MNTRRTGRALRLALIGLALLLIGGHECVMPLPASAGSAGRAHATGHHDHGDAEPVAVHSGECETLGLKASAPYAPVVVRTTAALVLSGADPRPVGPPRLAPVHRPPRFLLHAALLI
jgi:hypothetical protein